MSCYKKHGCGPYGDFPCSMCPASKPDYAKTSGDPDAIGADPIMHAQSDSRANLTPDIADRVSRITREMASQLVFLAGIVRNGQLSKSDVATHLGLCDHQIKELASALGQGSFLDEKLDSVTADLKQANKRIREMEASSGSKLSANAVCGALRHYEDIFRTWCALTGFHYASVQYAPRGLICDFSSEIEGLEGTDKARIATMHLGDKEIAEKIIRHTPYVFKDAYVCEDGLRTELLDTESNRNLLKELFATDFPQSHLSSLTSRSDRGQYLLGCVVYITYEDLQRWLEKTPDTSPEQTSCKGEI